MESPIHTLKNIFYALRLFPNELKIRLDPSNHRKIKRLEGIHKGKQCVVMLTGPSLNEVDCSLLDEHPFVLGVNGAFIKRNNFKYYFCSSQNFYHKNRRAIENVSADFFIFSSVIPFEKSDKRAYLLLDVKSGLAGRAMKRFEPNLFRTLSWGPTVLLDLVIPTCLWMGFSEIVLLGADYTLKGFKRFYELDNSLMLHSYKTDHEKEVKLAHYGFDELVKYLNRTKSQVKIYNCSSQSSLDHFPKCRLEDIIK